MNLAATLKGNIYFNIIENIVLQYQMNLAATLKGNVYLNIERDLKNARNSNKKGPMLRCKVLGTLPQH